MYYLKKTIKILFKSNLILIVFIFSYINIKLYDNPTFVKLGNSYYNQDVYYQLQFLKDKLHDEGAAYEMQNIYPEGFIFMNALYGLSWYDLIKSVDKSTDLFKEGLLEINWSIKQLDSENAKDIFDKNLSLNYGAFYSGWTNYLLGKKILLQPLSQNIEKEKLIFKENCIQISNAIRKSESPYLESYKGQFWPADMLTCIASLKIHDELFEKKYSKDIQNWLNLVLQKLDNQTGLVPHSVDVNGDTIENARGSSQSLILNFLAEIDLNFSKKQFEIYEKLFLAKRFGLYGVLEYPKGNKGLNDIDSGPVILGVGGSGSIVGQRTMAKHNNWTYFESLRNCIELFGVANTKNSKKKYLFGKLPMADAFIVWSNAIESNKDLLKHKRNWRSQFQVWSILLIIICLFLIKKY